jgi:hypothetical protein
MSYTAAQLIGAWTAANDGVTPDAATQSTLTTMGSLTQSGQLSDVDALAYLIDSAQDDVEVAVQAYQFFTGKSPSKAGLDYLTHSDANPTDLNDPYYLQFNLENRYINFAANLGLFGEGAAAFKTNFGGLGFAAFVDAAYEAVIGQSLAQAAGIDVAAAKADITARKANFEQLARDRGVIGPNATTEQVDLGIKASLIGYLLVEGVKADVGKYAAGANNFVAAVIAGSATYNTDILATYTPLGGGLGKAATPTTVGLPAPPAPPDPSPPQINTQGFALTTGTDQLTGTAGDDTFTGAAGAVQANDSIAGGLGTDTLVLTGNSSTVPTMTGVEVVKLVDSKSDIDLSGLADVTRVVQTGAYLVNVRVKVPSGAVVGMTDLTTIYQANYEVPSSQTTVTAQMSNLAAGGTYSMELYGAALTTVSVQSDGATTNHLFAFNTPTLASTLNIAGAAPFSVDLPLSNAVTRVDATGATGGVSLSLGTGAGATVSVVGSAAADTLSVGRLTGKSNIDLGAGDDVLNLGAFRPATGSSISGGAGFDRLFVTAIVTGGGGAVPVRIGADGGVTATGFEALTLDVENSGFVFFADMAVLDCAVAPGAQNLTIGRMNASLSLVNFPNGGTVTFAGGAGTTKLAINLADASGPADQVTIAGYPSTFLTISAPGVETVRFLAPVPSIFGTTLGVDDQLTLVKIDTAGTFLLDLGVRTRPFTVDGSGSTGSARADAAFAGVLVDFIGGPGDDVFSASRGGAIQHIRGGLGADNIQLNGGAQNVLVFASTADSRGANPDAVFGFKSGSDKIDLTALGLSASDVVIFSKPDVISFTSAVIAAAAADPAFFRDSGNALHTLALVDAANGNEVLFLDANHDGAFDPAVDMAIGFSGSTHILASDILN